MIQFLADQIDQMDLALDQLAMKDRNFDRFALMLVDNVVELTLHKHAEDKKHENDLWRNLIPPRHDPKAVSDAMGQYFDPKVKLGKQTGMLTPELGDSLLCLHSFRNRVYHAGLRHEGILHSLGLFHFQNACSVLANYSPATWVGDSRDQIGLRAMKYLGNARHFTSPDSFRLAWERLREVGLSLGDTLVSDLHADMARTVCDSDEAIQFVADDSPEKKSRDQVIIDCKVWSFAFTDEAKAFAAQNNFTASSELAQVLWISKNYPWPTKADPIPSWQNRLKSLEGEKNPHLALKKYCDFMTQTEDIRAKIDESAAGLDALFQQQEDIARGN